MSGFLKRLPALLGCCVTFLVSGFGIFLLVWSVAWTGQVEKQLPPLNDFGAMKVGKDVMVEGKFDGEASEPAPFQEQSCLAWFQWLTLQDQTHSTRSGPETLTLTIEGRVCEFGLDQVKLEIADLQRQLEQLPAWVKEAPSDAAPPFEVQEMMLRSDQTYLIAGTVAELENNRIVLQKITVFPGGYDEFKGFVQGLFSKKFGLFFLILGLILGPCVYLVLKFLSLFSQRGIRITQVE